MVAPAVRCYASMMTANSPTLSRTRRWPTRQRLLPLLIAALGVLSACGPRPDGAASNAASTAAAGSIAFSDCRLKHVDTLVRCAMFQVPEDHGKPDGNKLSIHVAVIPALARNAEPDPIYVFAGGPGQAASDLGRLLSAMPDLRKQRDLVLVDQRGTGKSRTITCESDSLGSKADPLVQNLTVNDEQMESERKRCLATLKGSAANHRTDDYIDDVEAVRKALGQARINVWGGSYGSRVGLRYMKRFPTVIRSAVLDGVAPTTLHLPDDALATSEAELRQVFAGCDASPGCSKAYPDSLKRFDSLLATLKAQPARSKLVHPATGAVIDATVSDRVIVGLMWQLLYQPEGTRLLPALLAQAADGNYAPLAATSAASSIASTELGMALRVSVMCAEDMLGRTPAPNPRFESITKLFYAMCQDFPHGKVAPEFFEPTVSDIPTLLLSGSRDPVTPPSQATTAARTLSQSKHIVVPNVGHIVSYYPCIRRIVHKFIEAGRIDAATDSCEAELKSPPPLFYVSPLEARP